MFLIFQIMKMWFDPMNLKPPLSPKSPTTALGSTRADAFLGHQALFGAGWGTNLETKIEASVGS